MPKNVAKIVEKTTKNRLKTLVFLEKSGKKQLEKPFKPLLPIKRSPIRGNRVKINYFTIL